MGGSSWKDGERQIAKVLKELWNVEFYRSESSGGLATSRQKTLPKSVVDALTGDVICDPFDPALDKEIGWPFSVEVKTRHDNIDVFDVCRRGKKSEIADWWDQCCRDSKRVNKLPLLFMKKVGGKGWYVGLDSIFLINLAALLQVDEIKNDLLNSCFSIQFYIAHQTRLMMSVIKLDNFTAIGRPKIEEAVRMFVQTENGYNITHTKTFFRKE